MNLLAPALLVGLLGLALPVVAHLLGREPPRRIPFAAVRFLEPREPTVTQRRRLHDVPLLVMRLLLLGLIVLALARPVTHGERTLSVVGEPHDAVVLVDASLSMGLHHGDEREIDRAVARVRELVDAMPPGSRAALVTTDPAGPRVEASSDLERIPRALEAWLEEGAPRPVGRRLADDLVMASSLLPPAEPDRERVIYAVGDPTPAGLGSLPDRGPEGIGLIPIATHDDATQTPEHVSIDAVSWSPAPDLDPRAVRIQAGIHRHGGAEGTERAVGVTLHIDDQEVARGEAVLEPEGSGQVEFTHTVLEGGAGPVAAEVRLLEGADPDPLPADDRRALWLAASERIHLLVVNGDPSERRVNDETFFLTTALNASALAGSVTVHSLAPDQLEERIEAQGAAALADADAMVLANVKAPSAAVAAALETRVREGMGLWITAGERVESAAYNQALPELLPLRLRGTSEAGTLPGRTQAKTEGLAPPQLSHPIFAGFAGDLALSATRTRRLLLVEPDPRRDAQVALAYSSGGPALVTSELERGHVALLTTSIDRDWSDLSLRPGFVPLVQHVVSWLAGAESAGSGAQLAAGTPWSRATDTAHEIRLPDGQRRTLTPDEGVITFDETWVPGHYRIRPVDADASEPTRVFAVVVDAAESDTAHDPGPETAAREGLAEVRARRPQWRWLVVLALCLLALETLTRARARSRRVAARRPPTVDADGARPQT